MFDPLFNKKHLYFLRRESVILWLSSVASVYPCVRLTNADCYCLVHVSSMLQIWNGELPVYITWTICYKSVFAHFKHKGAQAAFRFCLLFSTSLPLMEVRLRKEKVIYHSVHVEETRISVPA